MYTLIRNTKSHRDLFVEGASLVFSLIIAELFYKFGSFSLECAAFLATWALTSAGASYVRSLYPIAVEKDFDSDK